MKKAVSVIISVFGIYLISNCISILLVDSNHMGSSIHVNEGFIENTFEKNEFSEIESAKFLKDEVRTIIAEGKRGFELLWSTMAKLALSGLIIFGCGVYIYPRKESGDL